MPKSEMKRLMAQLKKGMKEAASNLVFEKPSSAIMRKTCAEEADLKPRERVKLVAGDE